jgi:hypothetical protein
MTLHRHIVDDRALVDDGDKPVHVPAGWLIAQGNSDDIRACGAHGWQSHYLVFANGDICGTAMCPRSSCRGARSRRAKNISLLIFQIGEKMKSNYLILDAQGARASNNVADVLLRRRA